MSLFDKVLWFSRCFRFTDRSYRFWMRAFCLRWAPEVQSVPRSLPTGASLVSHTHPEGGATRSPSQVSSFVRHAEGGAKGGKEEQLNLYINYFLCIDHIICIVVGRAEGWLLKGRGVKSQCGLNLSIDFLFVFQRRTFVIGPEQMYEVWAIGPKLLTHHQSLLQQYLQ